jgi:hypothetical protein
MLHLTLETIARLIDETPTADETAHLASCTACSAELDAMRQQTFTLTNLGDGAPPQGSWTALEKRLEREGLIAREPRDTIVAAIPRPDVQRIDILRRTRWSFDSAAMRAVAAILIFALGGLSGASLRGLHELRNNNIAAAHPDAQKVAASQQGAAPSTTSQATTQPNAPVELVQPSVRAASNNTAQTGRETPDASQDVRAAEAAYLRALARYSEQRPASATLSDPIARLATLESILLTTRAALREAPADPVINGYHLTALAERDAVLKQIAMQQSNTKKTSSGTWF